jgi:hypothetical protein
MDNQGWLGDGYPNTAGSKAFTPAGGGLPESVAF